MFKCRNRSNESFAFQTICHFNNCICFVRNTWAQYTRPHTDEDLPRASLRPAVTHRRSFGLVSWNAEISAGDRPRSLRIRFMSRDSVWRRAEKEPGFSHTALYSLQGVGGCTELSPIQTLRKCQPPVCLFARLHHCMDFSPCQSAHLCSSRVSWAPTNMDKHC